MKMTLNKRLYLLVEMAHHTLAWISTSLLAMGELWLNGRMDEGSVNGLRGKWSQGIHSGSITVCKGGMF